MAAENAEAEHTVSLIFISILEINAFALSWLRILLSLEILLRICANDSLCLYQATQQQSA